MNNKRRKTSHLQLLFMKLKMKQKTGQPMHSEGTNQFTSSDGEASTSAVDHGDARKENQYELHGKHHLAANLYILNHRLQKILEEFPFRPPVIVTATSLKKLSRRPSFESLGQQRDSDGHGLSRDTSFASMGSLKQSASSLSLAGSVGEDLDKLAHANQLSPEDAENAASAMVEEVLGFVKPIIPPIVLPRLVAIPHAHNIVPQSMPSAHATPAMPSAYHHQSANTAYATHSTTESQQQQMHTQGTVQQHTVQPLQHYHHAPHAPTPPAPLENHVYHQPQPQLVHYQHAPPTAPPPTQPQAPPGYTPVPSPLDHLPPAAAPTQQSANTPSSHSRKSSFLPPHLNVVPEDMFPANDTAAEDFFVGLMDDEDWAIGEGIDMDTTS